MPSPVEGMTYRERPELMIFRMTPPTSHDWFSVAAVAVALGLVGPVARAGHEVSYYPSFYPQEIRIEQLSPQSAAQEFVNEKDPLHAYFGAAPQFSAGVPKELKSVVSLR